jgi:hypothetical protein
VLWHYTCRDHGGAKIGESGVLRLGVLGVLWLTDLEVPVIQALGLDNQIATCDRTELRYRVDDTSRVIPWMEFRRGVHPDMLNALENVRSVMPRHWFVSLDPLSAVLDPLGGNKDER